MGVAVQLAAKAGAKMVIATASSDERLRSQALGMTHGINYSTHDVVEEVMRITESMAADVVDPWVAHPAGSILPSLSGPRLDGRPGRPRPAEDGSRQPDGRQPHDFGVFRAAEIATDRVQKNMLSLIDRVAKGELKAVIDREFLLSEAAAAHAYIGAARGRARPAHPVGAPPCPRKRPALSRSSTRASATAPRPSC